MKFLKVNRDIEADITGLKEGIYHKSIDFPMIDMAFFLELIESGDIEYVEDGMNVILVDKKGFRSTKEMSFKDFREVISVAVNGQAQVGNTVITDEYPNYPSFASISGKIDFKYARKEKGKNLFYFEEV